MEFHLPTWGRPRRSRFEGKAGVCFEHVTFEMYMRHPLGVSGEQENVLEFRAEIQTSESSVYKWHFKRSEVG